MYDTAINQITYISIIIILSITASVFFYANPARKTKQYRDSMNHFSAFFAFSAIGFTSYAFSMNQFRVVSIVLTNFFLISAFMFLRQGFIKRKSIEASMTYRKSSYFTIPIAVAAVNASIYVSLPDSELVRTFVTLLVMVTVVVFSLPHVSLKTDESSFGEKATMFALCFCALAISILLSVLFITNNKLLYLSMLTIIYSSLLVLLMGSIQTMFLSDFAEMYKKESNTDFLTGLNNRRYFMTAAQDLINQSKRSGKPSSTIMIDVDDFKFINDVFGHDIGDQVLKDISKVLKAAVRETDICARIGGEEFCLFLSNTDQKGACLLAERVREKAAALTTSSRICDVKASLSFGVCEIDDQYDLLESLKQADRALYFAKENGKNQVCNYERIKHFDNITV